MGLTLIYLHSSGVPYIIGKPSTWVQLFFKSHLNRRFSQYFMGLQSCESPNFDNFETPNLGFDNSILVCFIFLLYFGTYWNNISILKSSFTSWLKYPLVCGIWNVGVAPLKLFTNGPLVLYVPNLSHKSYNLVEDDGLSFKCAICCDVVCA